MTRHFSVSIEKDDCLRPASYHQDSLDPSACSIEVSSLAACNEASALVMLVDGGSNVFLVTTEDLLHNVVPHVSTVTGTGEIKAKVAAHGALILLFALGSRTFKVMITRCYVMPTNRHHTLGLALFRRAGYQKATHDIHNNAQ